MSIKIVHTSDWHLGKKLYKKDRIIEQEKFLSWLCEYLITKKIDILLVAGDVFDVPSPPNEAVNLYYDFLEELTSKSDIQIHIISGNHDSSSFLNAPKKILKKFNIKIFTSFSSKYEDTTTCFEKDNKKVEIKSIPYFRSYNLNKEIDKSIVDLTKEDYLDLLQETCSNWKYKNSFKIIQSHHAFGDFLTSESEHVLNLAGLESIPLGIITQHTDYVALGHIHKPQRLSTQKEVNYCGSPIPLRFSEIHPKIIKELTIDKELTVEDIKIPVFRRLIRLKARESNLNKLIDEIEINESTSWVEVQIKIDEPRSGLIEEIKKKLHDRNAELLAFYPIYTDSNDELDRAQIEIANTNIYDIFDQFYLQKFPDSKSTPKKIKEEFLKLLEQDLE